MKKMLFVVIAALIITNSQPPLNALTPKVQTLAINVAIANAVALSAYGIYRYQQSHAKPTDEISKLELQKKTLITLRDGTKSAVKAFLINTVGMYGLYASVIGLVHLGKASWEVEKVDKDNFIESMLNAKVIAISFVYGFLSAKEAMNESALSDDEKAKIDQEINIIDEKIAALKQAQPAVAQA
ncbi:MAG: hypothetical protein WCT20_01605 [Candidatus Babeliales bacterium]